MAWTKGPGVSKLPKPQGVTPMPQLEFGRLGLQSALRRVNQPKTGLPLVSRLTPRQGQ
jgi:hypothetical protein